MKTTLPDYNGRERVGKGIEWDAAGDVENKPYHIEARAVFETVADAEAFVAQFPKYIKFHATTLYTYDVANGEYKDNYQLGYASVRISLTPDKVTGAVNETGLKRIAGLLKTTAKLGITVTRVRGFGNSVDFTI